MDLQSTKPLINGDLHQLKGILSSFDEKIPLIKERS